MSRDGIPCHLRGRQSDSRGEMVAKCQPRSLRAK
jgi:hypothetical protein